MNRNIAPVSSQDATIQAVLAIDLEPIKYKMMTSEGGSWSSEQVNELEIWYKRYLMLTYLYPNQPLVPSHGIDMIWHTHILDTAKYADDCQRSFGKFVHHFPYFGVRSEEDRNDLNTAWENTIELFKKEFGTDPNFEDGLALCSGGSDCGNACAVCINPDKAKSFLNMQRPRMGDAIH